MGLTVVSNREPYRAERVRGRFRLEKTVGGLVSALEPILREEGGKWICWGRGKKEDIKDISVNKRFTVHPVHLTSADVSGYYYGFSNETLWPLCHMFLTRTHFNDSYWKAYRRVNRKFAVKVAEHSAGGELILVNDYHLALVPGFLRDIGVKSRVHFFWHIPFPPYFMLRFLPSAGELVEGMLGADVIGFHTEKYVENFLSCAVNLLGAKVEGDSLIWKGRRVRVRAVPIGIDTSLWKGFSEDSKVLRYAKTLRKRLAVDFIGVGVDRLDYTKGFEEKFKGIGRFFEKYPSFRGKVSFIQIAAPTRTKLEDYIDIKRRTDEIVGMIEGRFGEPGWVPIYYYYKSYPDERLASLYMMADFALVTPVIDGLNLVSKEYVATKSDGNGVLILSKFAGASTQLSGGALVVNPFDENEIAEAIYRALKMSKKEKRRRMEVMREEVFGRDINWWVREFLS